MTSLAIQEVYSSALPPKCGERFSFYGMKYLLVLYLGPSPQRRRRLAITWRLQRAGVCHASARRNCFPIATWVKRDLSN